ncbi:ABC transporter substrate-binding protein [Paenibacillus hodogayensis]|uniref:ABC transporter substrate-binding protein n=1 Tax=Paenibacillus hodogayensis TaxID=279208 RepID=A0ABV5VV45_9BACL
MKMQHWAGNKLQTSKRNKAAALVLGTMFLLAACSDAGGSGLKADVSKSASGVQEASSAKFASGPDETVEALYEKAKKEGKLIVYSPSGRANVAAESFMKQYPGIKVEVSKVKSDELMDKVTKEQDAGQFNPDVIITKEVSGAVEEEMVKPGRYIKYLPEDLAAKVDEPYRTQAESYANYVEFRTVFYNTDRYKSPPITNWWDLTTPEFQGKVYTADPLSSPAFMDLFTTMVVNSNDMAAAYKLKFGKEIELHGTENAGYEFIKQLFANKLVVLKGSDDVLDAIGKSGSDAVGLAVSGDVSKVKEKGWSILPIYDIKPKTSVPDSGYLFMAKNAPHAAAGKLFIRWMMGEKDGTGEGVKPFNEVGSWVPRSDVKTKNDIPFESLNLWLFNGDALYKTSPKVRDFWIKQK